MEYKLDRYTRISRIMTSTLFSLVLLFSSQHARALTFILDFTSLNTSETIFGASNNFKTNDLDVTKFGFTNGDFNSITSAILAGVIKDYTGYPTVGTNASSPIPDGKELNINFEIGTVFNAPTNGDSQYFFMKVGDKTPPTTVTDTLGHACYGCVRDAAGSGPTVANAALVGSILTDNIASISLSEGANGDLTKVANLLIGTISHEIGHTLQLDHAGQVSNPGDSLWTIMGTGASPSVMPNAERLLDRAFSYTEMAHLITAVGLRDVTAVPLPASVYMFGFSIALLSFMQRRRRAA